MIEVDPQKQQGLLELFRGQKQHVPVLAVIEGTYPGRVFVDSAENPTIALVWTIGRWSYMSGKAPNDDHLASLTQLLSTTITPVLREEGFPAFEIYVPNSANWIEQFDKGLPPFSAKRHSESVFTLEESKYREFRSGYSHPAELEVTTKEVPMLESGIIDLPSIPGRFREMMAIGCEVIVNGEVATLCRSNGFASGNEFMVDIVTFKRDLRRKGYATAAAVGLLDHCLETGLIPLWETTEDNLASRHLARKLGFVEQVNYPVYELRF